MRLLRGLAILLLSLVLVGIALGTWLVRRSFPATDGTAIVSALDAPVTVARNEAGVPHITASTLGDLFQAQGYVHAQDRFWQMDTWRHIGAGRLAEMFGESQLETDAFLRTLGFERAAAEAYAILPADVRSALDAYAEGVNAYLETRPGGSVLSLEYSILGIQNNSYSPEPWEPVDSLTWAHVMAWDLRSNLEQEIERALLAGSMEREAIEELYPPHPESHPVIVGEGGTAASGNKRIDGRPATGTDSRKAALGKHRPYPLTPLSDPPPLPEGAVAPLRGVADSLTSVESALGEPFEGIGSNSWVVDGSHTASGLPLLANDPHLGIQLPSIWYQTTLWCEEITSECPLRASGFTFPGAPAVVVGHNERIAWGVTNQGPDTMDLFVERTDGDRYLVDGEWEEIETRTETLEVAGGDDVELDIRTTRHGPIISDVYGAIRDLDPVDLGMDEDTYEISLAWQAMEPSTLFQAIYGMNLAADWDEFRRAASFFDIAAQNLVYADVDGNIGYQATGEIPIRRNGDGRYPVPGWTSEYDWDGLIEFEDLPSQRDPASGVIVTANQPVVDGTDSVFIGVDHAYGYRAARITELLAGGEGFTAEDFQEMQLDNYDASASFVVPALLDVPSNDPAVAEIQEILRTWSEVGDPYQMEAGSPGAAAYAALWRHLLAHTFDELPADHAPAGNGRFFEVVRRLLSDPTSSWWDDEGTAPVEEADVILARAARAAHEELSETLGDDPAEWRWGDLHIATFDNQTLGQSGIGPVEALLNRTAPQRVGGGSAIVNATGWHAAEGYDVLAVPSMRMVVDLADLGDTLAINTTGQSGHAFHRNYFDMAEDWVDGGMRRLPFLPEVSPGQDVLRLEP